MILRDHIIRRRIHFDLLLFDLFEQFFDLFFYLFPVFITVRKSAQVTQLLCPECRMIDLVFLGILKDTHRVFRLVVDHKHADRQYIRTVIIPIQIQDIVIIIDHALSVVQVIISFLSAQICRQEIDILLDLFFCQFDTGIVLIGTQIDAGQQIFVGIKHRFIIFYIDPFFEIGFSVFEKGIILAE